MRKFKGLLGILTLSLVVICLCGFFLGSAEIPPKELLDGLFHGDETAGIIALHLRLPRVLGGVLAGAGLAAAGVLLQCVTNNDLASPNLIGINSGAGFAVILLLSIAPTLSGLIPLAAFLGAMAAALVILFLSGRLRGGKATVLLIGVALTALLNSAISFLSLLDEDVLAQYNYFTVGSLKSVALGELVFPALTVAAGVTVALLLSHKLEVLFLGDSAASALGVSVGRLRLAAMACAAAMAAAAVSFCGLLGFVGLVVPQIGRKLAGERPSRLIPVSALLGSCLVVLADLLGRVLFAPSELPVGILMSLIGGPFFLILLLRRKVHAGIS